MDGELSRFEQLLLDAHVARCAACRTFKEQIGAATEAIRAAPRVSPMRPITVERRGRRPLDVLRPASAAAATIALVAGSVVISYQPGDERVLRETQPDVRAGVEALRQFQRTRREIRLEEALGPSSRPFQRPPGIAVPLTPP